MSSKQLNLSSPFLLYLSIYFSSKFSVFYHPLFYLRVDRSFYTVKFRRFPTTNGFNRVFITETSYFSSENVLFPNGFTYLFSLVLDLTSPPMTHEDSFQHQEQLWSTLSTDNLLRTQSVGAESLSYDTSITTIVRSPSH